MSYQRLSRYYDRLMGDFPYERYADYLSPFAYGKGLDLACGTGRMTILLARKGMTMQGVDLSGEMLNIAVSQARKEGVRVSFREEDMRRFSFSSGYNLITAVCDGVNYLAPQELGCWMQRVANALLAGGHLVFDVSSPYKLQRILGDNLYFEDYDDLTYYWQNKQNPRRHSVSLTLTFFEKEGDKYVRYDEAQTQYWHTKEEICLAAQSAGLSLVAYQDGDFGKVHAKSQRIIYTFVKQ